MPEIRAFRGITYDPARVEVALALAPPYDVITPERRTELYERSPFNIIRLVLNRDPNPYASAAEQYRRWRSEGRLVADDRPSVYLLSQRFSLPGGAEAERSGFIAACRLEDFGRGSVFPHERTHAAPKEDRFRLFEATGAMFSQVFSLYSDPGQELAAPLAAASGGSPFLDVTEDGVRTRMWKSADGAVARTLAGFLKDKRVTVADGHHRYETALLYRDSLRLKHPGSTGGEPYNFVPMFFTNMDAPGLVILPTHRLVYELPPPGADALVEGLSRSYSLHPVEREGDLLLRLQRSGPHAFGLVLPDYRPFSLLTPIGAPADPDELDVAVLHRTVFAGILNITPEMQERKNSIGYEHDAPAAIAAVKRGRAQAAFLVNPTRIEQVRAIAESGRTMPQKSTFFYPKLLSGVVAYSFLEP